MLLPRSRFSTFVLTTLCGLVGAGLPGQLIALQDAPPTRDVRQDDRFLALSWIQNSAEYQLLSAQTYRLALGQLAIGAADPKWCADEVQIVEGNFETKTPAVILDVDETVLDNSAFNARNIVEGRQYTTDGWNAWCAEEKSRALPGALEFTRAAEGLGVKVYYVTNRRDEVKQATINNLNSLGFKADENNVLTRNADAGRGDDKVSRRAMVAEHHRIVMLIGDSMSDLCSGMDEFVQEKRNATASEKTAMLGSRWIIMPNPVYGGWERALPRDEAALRLDR